MEVRIDSLATIPFMIAAALHPIIPVSGGISPKSTTEKNIAAALHPIIPASGDCAGNDQAWRPLCRAGSQESAASAAI